MYHTLKQSLQQRLHLAEKEIEGIAEERAKYRGIIVSQSNQLGEMKNDLDVMSRDFAVAKKKADQHDVGNTVSYLHACGYTHRRNY